MTIVDAQAHELAGLMRNHWWYRGRSVAVVSLATRAGVPRGAGPVLDYGCGTGHMGAVLSRFGPVFGVDASEDAFAAGHYEWYAGVSRIDANDSYSAPGRRYTLIACLDVLEHVEDDLGLLRSLAGLVLPGGHLIVSVPMWPELLSPAEIQHAGHLRRYAMDGLGRLFASSSLRPVATSGYVVSLLPLAKRQRRRILAGKAQYGDEHETPTPVVNEALALWAGAEGALCRWFALPTGLSQIIVLTPR